MEYEAGRRDEVAARVRRSLALLAMVAQGSSQREIARVLGVSQPAVSQQVGVARGVVAGAHPEVVVAAGGRVLAAVAQSLGFSRLAVFGSVARGEASEGSDIDLLVCPPVGSGLVELTRLRDMLQAVVGRPVDVVTYGSLRQGVDDDVLAEAREL